MRNKFNQSENRLFSNAGEKIQTVAEIIMIVASLLSIIGGIIIMMSGDELVPYGLLMIILGPVLAWLSTLMLYGFGTLVKNSEKINSKLDIE